MLQFLIKPLIGVAGDMIKGVVDTKKAKAEAKIGAVALTDDQPNGGCP